MSLGRSNTFCYVWLSGFRSSTWSCSIDRGCSGNADGLNRNPQQADIDSSVLTAPTDVFYWPDLPASAYARDLWIAACARDTACEWPAISDLGECGLQEAQQLDDAIGAVGDDFDFADHDSCSDQACLQSLAQGSLQLQHSRRLTLLRRGHLRTPLLDNHSV